MRRIFSATGLALFAALGANGAMAAKALTVQTETIPVTSGTQSDTAPLSEDDVKVPQSSSPPPSDDPKVKSTDAGAQAPLPEVLYSTDYLPKPVARMHSQLKEAALLGDMKRLRMVLESNELPPTLSFGEIGDPIEFLKQSSGDGEGFEILAILADVLDAGFIHVDKGTPQEMYVWPYFARFPLHDLTAEQKVELFRIVTAGDFAEMQDFGAWSFYRVGIGPDGTLHYFVAGD
ncbi:hypothetical protein [uncultured Roseibium sp.]|uniref:hypothetical protein n=1 Tax=uncultured Roseibium sp. TaxID=1936171 RepID=UPI00260B8739|nr:hypothetical protein [uncultured Roseibium sp.]